MGKYEKRICLMMLMLLCFFSGLPLCGRAKTEEFMADMEDKGEIWNGVAGSVSSSDQDVLRILFVGNSMTGRNDMPAVFQRLAEAGGHKVYVEWIWQGGGTLVDYADKSRPEGKVFSRKLRSKSWDYVVLQERSRRPLYYPKAAKKTITTLVQRIQRLGSEPVLFMTWAHEEGASFYQSRFAQQKKIDPKKFYQKIADFYNQLGEENGILVAKVGTAFWRCSKYWSGIRLYRSGKFHPTKAGSYLAACTFYASIFQEEIPKKNLAIPKKTAATLRRVSEKVTFQ